MEHVSSTLDPSSDWLSHQSIYIELMGRASFLLRAAAVDTELRMLVLGMVLATKTSQGRDKLVAALSASLKAEWLNSGLVAFNRHQNLLSMITGEEGID